MKLTTIGTLCVSLEWAAGGVLVAAGQSEGLVLHYSFEGAAADAMDSSGYGNHGTLVETHRVPGVAGRGVGLDGTVSCIRTPSSASLMPEAFTLAAWVYLERTPSDVYPLIFKRNRGYNDNEDYSLQVTPEGRARLVLGNGRWQRILDSSVKLESGRWHHVAATFAQPRMAVYVDGRLAATAPYDQVLQHNPESDVFIGSRDHQVHPMGPYAACRLDEVRIYRRELPAEEMAALSAAPDGQEAESGAGLRSEESSAWNADSSGDESVLVEIAQMRIQGGSRTEATLRWASIPGKAYAILWSTNLVGGFVELTNGWVATNHESVFTHRTEGIPAAYYAVRE